MNNEILVISSAELEFLRPVVVSNLRRYGNAADGGYALTSIALSNSDFYLSLGLGENWSFETEISRVNPQARIDTYDDTVHLKFFAVKALKGLVKFLVMRDSSANLTARLNRLLDYFRFWLTVPTHNHHKIHVSATSFEKILGCYPKESRIGLKVDIEGSEWKILGLISQEQFRFEFIVIEIHDFDNHVNELREFLRTLSSNFVIAHLHANNYGTLGDNGFPKVFELTLLRDSREHGMGMMRKQLPVPELDVPNSKSRPDFKIMFPG